MSENPRVPILRQGTDNPVTWLLACYKGRFNFPEEAHFMKGEKTSGRPCESGSDKRMDRIGPIYKVGYIWHWQIN